MGYATTKQAIEWLREEIGGAASRSQSLSALNDARRVFYTIYQRLKLNFYVEANICIRDFQFPEILGPYCGISLPQEMEQVEAVWSGVTPIGVRDQWFEYATYGRSQTTGTGKLEFYDAGSDHSIPFDWDGDCARLRFSCASPMDRGKHVRVSFIDSNGEPGAERIKVDPEGALMTAHVKTLARPGIVLEDSFSSVIMVTDETDGKFLGRLNPSISVPTFKRLKVGGLTEGYQVGVRATRKYVEVSEDWEVIETDDKLLLLEAHRYLVTNSAISVDPQKIQASAQHLNNVQQFLAGNNMRTDGAATLRNIDLSGRRGIRRSRFRTAK